jgi:tetratricopeptide (TPR) repeat protein
MLSNKSLDADVRFASYYLKVLQDADYRYRQGGSESRKALELFDIELDGIKFVFEHLSHQLLPEAINRLCCELYRAGRQLFYLRLHPTEHVRWAELAVTAAQLLGDQRVESLCRGGLGVAQSALGDFPAALANLSQYLDAARKRRDRRAEAVALGNLGMVYTKLGQAAAAINCHDQQLPSCSN